MDFSLCKFDFCDGDLEKSWFIYYSYRHPESGKMQRFKIYISTKIKTAAARREKAQNLIQAVNTRLRSGWNPYQDEAQGTKPINWCIDHFLALKKKILRQRSYTSYVYHLGIFQDYIHSEKLFHLTIEEFNYKHSINFSDYIRIEKNLDTRTYNNIIGTMVTFFNFWLDRNYIEVNPFRRIKKMPRKDPRILAFTDDEINLIRKTLPPYNPRLWIISQLIYYCYLRPQELVRLKPEHFNLKKKEIIIPPEVSKNKKYQRVSIPTACIPVVKMLDIDGIDAKNYVFSRHLLPGDAPIAPTRIAEIWRKYADSIGIKKTIYLMKHTSVGRAIEAGINIRDLQLQLRHHSLEMTQIYLQKFNSQASENLNINFPEF